MITLDSAYVFAGVVFAGFALLSVRDRSNPRRFGNACFWGLIAASFLYGSRLSDTQNGFLALALAILGGCRLMGAGRSRATRESERVASAARCGNWLFVPALVVPVTALFGSLVLKNVLVAGAPLVDPKQATVISLALGVAIAWVGAVVWLQPRALVPLDEGRRLMDAIGWAAVLPQMLASLGAVFALAGVGKDVGTLATAWIPLDHPFAAVCAYCIGMALFTALMGNAFAAFPVMTAAIGLPLIVHKFGGSPAIMSAIGMLSGFCGTLATPMAANFNIVPAALLELPDRNAVIKAQLPSALLLLLCNMLLMYVLVFRFGAHHA
ncbi:MAG TPA: DUF979 domain-containing protein [Rhizomicrobium sp.]